MRKAPAITIITTTGIVMDDAALLKLMSWLSPAFPVGGFSYSHGIEYAVEARLVTDEAALEDWTRAALRHEFAPVSGVLLREAYQAAIARDTHALRDTLEDARALVPTPEFELETKAQGTAFLSTLRAAWPQSGALDGLDGVLREGWVAYPCAVGIAAAAAGVPLDKTLTAFLHAVVSNLLSAGIRLIPLGQTAGQRILARLLPDIMAAARTSLTRAACDMGAACPMIEWTSMRHQTQYTRLFRS